MIKDPVVIAQRSAEWAAVRTLCANASRGHVLPGTYFTSSAPEGFLNLPFVLAFAVLDQVLADLVDQGTFLCKGTRPLLGVKMAASEHVLPWKDYTLVEAGKNARNDMAHRAILLSDKECLSCIEAIVVELKAWGVF